MGITQNALVALVLSVFLVIIISLKNRHAKTKAARIMDDATKAGRFTYAVEYKSKHYLNSWHGDRGNRNSNDFWEWKIWYRYEVNGRTYKLIRHYKPCVIPPNKIVVYWEEGKPGKAYASEFDKLGAKYTSLMLMPYIIFLLVFGILQGISSVLTYCG